MKQMIASVFHPIFPEIGVPQVGAWVFTGARKVTCGQRRRLQQLLPPNADVMYGNGTFRIEMDIPPEQRDEVSKHRLAKSIRAALLKGLGVKAGLCPVASTREIQKVTRRG